MSRTPRIVAALSAALLAATGCTSEPEADLPAASDLLAAGAIAMADVKTAEFGITVDGKINGLTLQKADGKLTREGSAEGTATIEQSGALVEIAFIIVGDSAYLKAATGDYQKLPLAFAASVYDPSAILDPERGVAKLLTTAQNAKTEALEDVNGRDAYKISFDPDPTAVAALIPGTAKVGNSQIWLDKETNRVVQATFPFTDSGQTATVSVTFSDYDAPVTISAP